MQAKFSAILCFAVLCFALLCSAGYAQNTTATPSYTFAAVDLPFSGASNTKAFAINPAGDIVGRFFDGNQGGKPRGFLGHSDGTFAPPIDVPVANSGTVPRGNIVGVYTDAAGDHGFIGTKAN